MASKELLLGLYEKMLLARRFEERMVSLFQEGLIPGAVHLGIGQEAFAVGAVAPLRKDDYLLFSHRGFAHCIAKGMTPREVLAEYMGRKTGCAGGQGGVHLADMRLGIPGISGCQGGNHIIAVGFGMAAKMKERDQVTACFFGEGTANRGTFLEGINMAALYKLPVIFLCENNLYGFSTSQQRAMVAEHVADRARGLGLPGKVVDGNDVLSVYQVVKRAVERARAGEGPSLIEGMTYRWIGHHERDPGTGYRSQKEVKQWKKKCPILKLKKILLEKKMGTFKDLARMNQKVLQQVEEAVDFAKTSEFPIIQDLQEIIAYYDIKPKPRA